ncbi:UNKNOWN [Stylonychia lemnae]|uniref:Rubisco LSMT substrate-binding domain-containing protein n=1 Tax=Stylonychia lemnae TaxID=5949 RepID=A0A077ZWB4_STYLE|nr:UNKNOWN [Stylonychia lemnae]|eukprot:CDW73560.1 UNKNOWN [Stylonychia lemnae]
MDQFIRVKKALYLCILVSFILLLQPIVSQTHSEKVQRYLDFYKTQFNKFSDALEPQYDINNGFYIAAKRDFKANETVLNIPLKFIVSNFDNFKFKKEMMDLCLFNQEIKKQSRETLHLYLLVLRFMVEFKSNYDQPFGIDTFEDVEFMQTWLNYMKDHINYEDVQLWSQELRFFHNNISTSQPQKEANRKSVYEEFMRLLSKHKDQEFKKVMESALLDIREFYKWVSAVTQSHQKQQRKTWLTMNGISSSDKYEGIDLNNKLGPESIYIVPMIDMFSFYIPQTPKDEVKSLLNPQPGLQLDMSVNKGFKKGQSVNITNKASLDSYNLLYNYGIVIDNNPYANIMLVHTNHYSKFDVFYGKICEALQCVSETEEKLTESKQLNNSQKEFLTYKLSKGPISKNLMNMLRVHDLNLRKVMNTKEEPFFEANKINLQLNVDGIFQFNNEIYAINEYITAVNSIQYEGYSVTDMNEMILEITSTPEFSPENRDLLNKIKALQEAIQSKQVAQEHELQALDRGIDLINRDLLNDLLPQNIQFDDFSKLQEQIQFLLQ